MLQNGGWAYLTMMNSRPQAVGYGLADSPAGLAAFMLVHGGFRNWTYGKDPNQAPTRDEVLDDISLYWLTNTAVSAARLYWENRNVNLISAAAQKTDEITIPVAIMAFPDGDLYRAPETWARRAFPSLIYFRAAERGGGTAALLPGGPCGLPVAAVAPSSVRGGGKAAPHTHQEEKGA